MKHDYAKTTSGKPPVIIKGEVSQVPQLVDLHKRTNPNAYLTSLGDCALAKMYSRFILDPNGIAFVALPRGTNDIIGVVIGCVSPKTFYWTLGRLLFRFHLKTWIKSVATGRQKFMDGLRRVQSQNSLLPKGDIAYLAQINVLPEFQRENVATALIGSFHDHLREDGAYNLVYLISDKNNDSARRLYENSGYTLCKEFFAVSGTTRCLYRNDLRYWEGGQHARTGRRAGL